MLLFRRDGSLEKDAGERRESGKAASELDKKDGEGESAKTVFTGSTPSTPEEASKPAPPLPSERYGTSAPQTHLDPICFLDFELARKRLWARAVQSGHQYLALVRSLQLVQYGPHMQGLLV